MIADTREKFNYIAIILTGYSEFEYAQQAIRNGVSDYVLKPLDMDEMRTALEKAVRLAGITSTSNSGGQGRGRPQPDSSAAIKPKIRSLTRWCCAS